MQNLIVKDKKVQGNLGYDIIYVNKGFLMVAIEQKQLFENIEVLPIDMKTKLVTMLLKSINPTDKSVDAFWIQEINKRKEAIESGKVETIAGNVVFQRIEQRFSK